MAGLGFGRGLLGITYRHSRPYHPQTCGKIERWHQTLKRHLAKQPEAATINELQTQIDRFVEISTTTRHHRARGRITPTEAFNARNHAGPGSPTAPTHFRVRTDRVDIGGKVTLRHNSKLLHIGIGRRYAGTPIRLYVADLDVRIKTTDGELLRHLTIDPTSRYQGLNREAH